MTARNTPAGAFAAYNTLSFGRAGLGTALVPLTPVPGAWPGSIFASTPGTDSFWSAIYSVPGVSQIPSTGQLWPRGF